MYNYITARLITDAILVSSCVASLILYFEVDLYFSAALVICSIFSFIASAKVVSITQRLSGLESDHKKLLADYSSVIPSRNLLFISYPHIRVVSFLLLVAYLSNQTEFALGKVVSEIENTAFLFKEMLTPEWSLLHEAISIYARQTLEVALLGTILAFFTALPLSIIMSKNTSCIVNVGFLHLPTKSLVSVIRAMPTFLLGLIFVALVGLGPMPGVLAIYVFSVGIMAKQFSESIESLSGQPEEAIHSVSGTRFHKLVYGYAIQGSPLIAAHLFYCLEINIHSATVLGLIGAEGIGLPIHEYITAFAYSEASVFIIVVIGMTVITDQISNYIRHRLI